MKKQNSKRFRGCPRKATVLHALVGNLECLNWQPFDKSLEEAEELKQALRELCTDSSYQHLLAELFDFLNCLAILEAQGTTIYKSYSAAGFSCGYGGGQQVVLAIQSPTLKYHYDVWVARAVCAAHREVLEHEDMDQFTHIFCAWYFSQLARMRPMLPPFSLYTFFIDKMNWMAEDSNCYNASEKIYPSISQSRLESLIHTFVNWELKH